jgi:hypothetical protein
MMRSVRRGNFLSEALSTTVIVDILLFSLIPGVTLIALGWHCLGGGSEIENIHLAAYLLVLLLVPLTVADPAFREKTFRTPLWYRA